MPISTLLTDPLLLLDDPLELWELFLSLVFYLSSFRAFSKLDKGYAFNALRAGDSGEGFDLEEDSFLLASFGKAGFRGVRYFRSEAGYFFRFKSDYSVWS